MSFDKPSPTGMAQPPSKEDALRDWTITTLLAEAKEHAYDKAFVNDLVAAMEKRDFASIFVASRPAPFLKRVAALFPTASAKARYSIDSVIHRHWAQLSLAQLRNHSLTAILPAGVTEVKMRSAMVEAVVSRGDPLDLEGGPFRANAALAADAMGDELRWLPRNQTSAVRAYDRLNVGQHLETVRIPAAGLHVPLRVPKDWDRDVVGFERGAAIDLPLTAARGLVPFDDALLLVPFENTVSLPLHGKWSKGVVYGITRTTRSEARPHVVVSFGLARKKFKGTPPPQRYRAYFEVVARVVYVDVYNLAYMGLGQDELTRGMKGGATRWLLRQTSMPALLDFTVPAKPPYTVLEVLRDAHKNIASSLK